jgi:hypothetical protein
VKYVRDKETENIVKKLFVIELREYQFRVLVVPYRPSVCAHNKMISIIS